MSDTSYHNASEFAEPYAITYSYIYVLRITEFKYLKCDMISSVKKDRRCIITSIEIYVAWNINYRVPRECIVPC